MDGRRINVINLEGNQDNTDTWVVPANCPHIYRFIWIYWWFEVVWVILGRMWDLFFGGKNFFGIFFFFLTSKDIIFRGGASCAKVNLKPPGHLLRTDWYKRNRNINRHNISVFPRSIPAQHLLMLLKNEDTRIFQGVFYHGWLCFSCSKIDMKTTSFLGMFSFRKKKTTTLFSLLKSNRERIQA